MSKRPIERDDLLDIKFVGGPQVSPAGSEAVFTMKYIDEEKNSYFAHLWHMDMATHHHHQFTFGEVSDALPKWSPDGNKIAFIRSKDKQSQIWMIPAHGGEARQVTQLGEGAITGFDWAPDSQQLVFSYRPKHEDWTREAAEKRKETGKSNPVRIITKLPFRAEGFGFLDERQNLWICNVETGKTTQLTNGEHNEFDPVWSPDGKSIAFFANLSEDPSATPYKIDLWIISNEGGEPKKIHTPLGYKGGLAFSPSGGHLSYTGIETSEDPWFPYHNRVWVVPVDGGDAQCLTSNLDRMVGNMALSDTREAFHGAETPYWSDDGAYLYFSVSDQGSTHLYRVAVTGGEPEALTAGAIDVISSHGDPASGKFLMQIALPTQPAELFSATLNGHSINFEQITHYNQQLLEQIYVNEPEEIWTESTENTQVHGWVLKPHDFDENKKYPMLLYIHGGPHAQYGNTFFHELQWHAANGYVVLYTNPRGSRGYSEDYATSISSDWGKRDYEDVMAAVDHIAQRPYIDEARMATAGGSYGGYMTNWIIGHNDKFKCAITDRSVFNFQSMFSTSDIVFQPDGYWAGNPWSDPDKLRQQSPQTYFENVKCPVLIVHSEGDLRCPIEQAEQLFVTLKRIGVEVVFARYPAETNHGLSRSGPPDLRLDRLQRIADWLDKHLQH